MEIITDDNLREMKQHGSMDYAFQYYIDDLQLFDNHVLPWHWHREFEFITMEKGAVNCYLGSLKLDVQEGEGVFINSGILHSFRAQGRAIMPNILFAPEFIAGQESRIYKKFVQPFPGSDISYMYFQKSIPWQKKLLEELSEIYRLCEKNDDTLEIAVHGVLTRLWTKLYEHKQECVTIPNTGVSMAVQGRLKKMTYFIEHHYQDKLTLEQIASAANISKSEALRCFRDGMQTTPVGYLNQYRLLRAKKLLYFTEDTICQIAGESGFDSASYFNRMFKREFCMTPKEYRSAQEIIKAD